MSESGDSFEKIEFEQFTLSRLVSNQESNDLINDDQHSVITMTSSANQVTLQLEDLEFELAWKCRDEIILSLNRHTELLSGLIIKADARENLRKANNDLVATLMNLSVKVDGRSRSLESLGRSPDDGPNEVLLDLSSEVRSRIVDTLMINNSLALDGDSVSSECKAKLINRNHDLICELLKLRSRTVAISGDSSASKGNY